MSAGIHRVGATHRLEDRLYPLLVELFGVDEVHREVWFPELRGLSGARPLRYDFYMPADGLLVEADGAHHTRSVYMVLDELKAEFAVKAGLRLVRIKYDEALSATALRLRLK